MSRLSDASLTGLLESAEVSLTRYARALGVMTGLDAGEEIASVSLGGRLVLALSTPDTSEDDPDTVCELDLWFGNGSQEVVCASREDRETAYQAIQALVRALPRRERWID